MPCCHFNVVCAVLARMQRQENVTFNRSKRSEKHFGQLEVTIPLD